MIPKDVITISRHWNNPQIRTQLTFEGISLSCSLEDFLTALSQEMGWTATPTSASTLSKLKTCAEVVCARIKEESVKVM